MGGTAPRPKTSKVSIQRSWVLFQCRGNPTSELLLGTVVAGLRCGLSTSACFGDRARPQPERCYPPGHCLARKDTSDDVRVCLGTQDPESRRTPF